MRRVLLTCIVAAPWLSVMGAEAPARAEPKSVCAIADQLMNGCTGAKAPIDPHAEVSLDFSIDSTPARKLLASVGETTAKTGVVITAEQSTRQRAPRPEEQSEWCNPKKD